MPSEQWVILELGQKAEGEDPELVRRSIVYAVKGADVFIPAAITEVGGDRVVNYLVEGYAFIRHEHPDTLYSRLENSKYVQRVVTKVGRLSNGRPVRKLALVTTQDVDRMRRQIAVETDQGIAVGDTVLITSGAYKQIEASVIEDIPEQDTVQVHVQLRSKDSIVSLPRSFLRLVAKAGRPTFLTHFERLKDEFGAYHILQHDLPIPRFAGPYRAFSRLSGWCKQCDVVRVLYVPLSTEPLRAKVEPTVRLLRWVDRWQLLVPMVQRTLPPAMDFPALQALHLRMLTAARFLEQLNGIENGVGRIESQLRAGDTMITNNVIVDGFNLAYRCHYAPGLNQIHDAKGRATGVIFGFLRSLAYLRTRFNGAHIYVAWDGSNQARKKRYPGYKANRPTGILSGRDASDVSWDQIRWIRTVLPGLGVTQVYNPLEEADDVVASLLRKDLRGQQNVIFSTDCDFLQLLSETDLQLVPAQGKRKEVLYDLDALQRDWGVSPGEMVSLRAFLGDTSDNLPGVATVPQKVLVDLVRMYKTVDSIYSSNLAGLTSLRYRRLREAEQQVRLNVELMTLRSVSFFLDESRPDEVTSRRHLEDVNVNPEPIVLSLFGTSLRPVTLGRAS